MHSSVDHRWQSLTGKNVLVTGACGFIGANLVRRLVGTGCHVLALVRPGSDIWRIGEVLEQVHIIESNVHNLTSACLPYNRTDVQTIFHLAATGVNQTSPDPQEIASTNVMGTLQMLRFAREVKAERFIYCGSCLEYGAGTMLSEDAMPAPATEYAASKVAAWMFVQALSRQYGLPAVSLRPFTVYGPYEGAHRLIPFTVNRALAGREIELTGGKQMRDFIFVDDVVIAFLSAAVIPDAIGGTFNVCTGMETSVSQIVQTIVRQTGSVSKPCFGARPYRDGELWRLSGDPARARRTLGWSAETTLADGLTKTIEWFRENRAKHSAYTAMES